MLKKRPTETQWVVFSGDPALTVIPYKQLNEYMLDRNINKLPIDFDKKCVTLTGEPVTLFKVKPLSRKAALAMQASELFSDDVVRTHVIEVYNYDGVAVGPDPESGDRCLTRTSIEVMDDAVLEELRLYLRDHGRGADGDARPFSSPDGWSGDRLRSLQLSANIARIDQTAAGAAATSDSDPNQA